MEFDESDQRHILQAVVVGQAAELDPQPLFERIVLNLPRWTGLANEVANEPYNVTYVKEVFEYFLHVATRNRLQETPAAEKISGALKLLTSFTPTTNVKDIPLSARLAYQETAVVFHNLNEASARLSVDSSVRHLRSVCQELGHLAKNSVPIFNIWDSISLLYTLCVEDVSDNLHAELHLFQLRTIVQVLKRHKYTGPARESPSTVVAAWSKPEKSTGRPVRIAFAATCCGSNAEDKKAMGAARYAFAKRLIEGINIVTSITATVEQFYIPGNCPEWISIILVCRTPGQYYSVCHTTSEQGRIYKLCGYCEKLQRDLATMKIRVIDMWNFSNLGDGKPVKVEPSTGFSYRVMMTYKSVSNKFGDIRKGVA